MTFVEEYAHLEHEASIYQAHGKPVPARIQQRAAYIEGFVKSQLHPAQIQAAIQQKDRILANLHRQRIEIERGYHEHVKQEALAKATAAVTQGMLGQKHLTPQQLRAVVTKQPLRAQIPKQQHSQAQRDAAVRAQTKALDPRGIGWGEREFEKRMDALTDASSPREFARLASGYRNSSPSDLRKAANRWRSERVRHGLSERTVERYGESKPGPVLNSDPDHQVQDRDHRRAVLATAFLADANDQYQKGDHEQISGLLAETPDYMSKEEGRRGDVARAFDSAEG